MNRVVAFLLVSNLASVAALGYFIFLDQQHRATTTTDTERTVYGRACVAWLEQRDAEVVDQANELRLGRSWRKHGQMVFEVFEIPHDGQWRSDLQEYLCTVDAQSEVMFAYTGTQRDRWMFY